MTFSSTAFMFIFLPAVMLLYYIVPGIKLKNVVLLIASVLFYAWGEPVYVLLMLLSALVNYLLALPGQKAENSPKLRKGMVIATIVFNIGMLAVFKYTGLFVRTLDLFGADIAFKGIALPIGISFYTFQAMSYVIDVYRGVTDIQKNFFKLLLYICFFPQLIAGPIVKYHDIAEQIDDRTHSVEGAAQGARRFVFGLGKKLIIANGAAEIVALVDGLADTELSAAAAWLAAIAYCIQIYFDFSGYSDMALGLASMAGFELKENFDYPYTAVSIKDFWRKWHISLSTWFKEYVYIPLGGNRKGTARTGVNKLIVFFLTGLWHGASWTYVAWGLMHGLFIMLETYGVLRPEKWKPKFLSRIYTLLIVCLAFVLFRTESFSKSAEMFTAMFTRFAFTDASLAAFKGVLLPFNLICIGLGILFSVPLLRPLWRQGERITKKSRIASVIGYVSCVPIYVLCAVMLAVSSYNPFIYFRF